MLAHADTARSIRVFVALCDNKTQGIQPVRARIGDGDKPDDNLYWGCTDGLEQYFTHSKSWKLTSNKRDLTSDVMRRVQFVHTSDKLTLTADAYRGSSMRKCIADFELELASGKHDLVVFIGHNGLMDFHLPEAAPPKANKAQAIVLCCLSDAYFNTRIRNLQAQPVLLTSQLMYPGAFILHDVIEVWRGGGSLQNLRLAAAKAYAKNQKISEKSAARVFAPIRDDRLTKK
jgi:hypothetical protein